jgi:hypothetical protein
VGDILRRREQCLERRETKPSHRVGAAWLAVEAHRKGNRSPPGDGRSLPDGCRVGGAAIHRQNRPTSRPPIPRQFQNRPMTCPPTSPPVLPSRFACPGPRSIQNRPTRCPLTLARFPCLAGAPQPAPASPTSTSSNSRSASVATPRPFIRIWSMITVSLAVTRASNGMGKLPQTAAEDLLEITMRRCERASTLLTSNRAVGEGRLAPPTPFRSLGRRSGRIPAEPYPPPWCCQIRP